jgi:hypothetical protein
MCAASSRYGSTLKAMKKMVDLLRNFRSPSGEDEIWNAYHGKFVLPIG